MALLRSLVCSLVLLSSVQSSCLAAKFVMFPMFGRSHYLVHARLGKELASRGHEVVIFVGECETYATNDPNVRMFQFPEEVKISASLLHVVQGWHDYCDAELSNQAIMNEVKSADLVIGDGLYVCSSLIADKFSLPHVTVLMFSMTSATAALPYNFAEIPSYIPQLMSEVTDNMKFLQRAKNSVVWLVNRVIFPLLFTNAYAALKEKYSITPEKTLEQTFQRVDLVLVQTEAFEYPRPLLPNTKLVGPLLPSPAKPLPDDLEEFVRGSGDKGVILSFKGVILSFGTVLGEIDENATETMAAVFSSLPQRVIWKPNTGKSLKIGSNVKVSSWLPQNDILGHPKTRLFIGHAGMNGMLEAAYHGVPMICVPFFGDQFDNAVAARHFGMAEVVAKESITKKNLATAIDKVLNNPSYRESAARISRSMKMHPRTPVQQAADWVEYTQAQGSLAHLRPRGLDLPLYQLYLLDVMCVATMLLIGVLAAVCYLIRCFCRVCFKPNKGKTQ